MLALSLGAQTMKMEQGHHGANHPVKDLVTGKVEIVSMNHGFTVDAASLPDGVEESHRSLFDGTNSGPVGKRQADYLCAASPRSQPRPAGQLSICSSVLRTYDALSLKASAISAYTQRLASVCFRRNATGVVAADRETGSIQRIVKHDGERLEQSLESTRSCVSPASACRTIVFARPRYIIGFIPSRHAENGRPVG